MQEKKRNKYTGIAIILIIAIIVIAGLGMSGEEKVYIYPKMANRHGLIAGATGTGKTVTLKDQSHRKLLNIPFL